MQERSFVLISYYNNSTYIASSADLCRIFRLSDAVYAAATFNLGSKRCTNPPRSTPIYLQSFTCNFLPETRISHLKSLTVKPNRVMSTDLLSTIGRSMLYFCQIVKMIPIFTANNRTNAGYKLFRTQSTPPTCLYMHITHYAYMLRPTYA